MQTYTKPKRWGYAILLNALVMPGSGHILIGEKLKGYAIGAATLFLVFVPLIRYLASVAKALNGLVDRTGPIAASITSLSLAWDANRGLILKFLIALVILWAYGIVDLVMKKRRDAIK